MGRQIVSHSNEVSSILAKVTIKKNYNCICNILLLLCAGWLLSVALPELICGNIFKYVLLLLKVVSVWQMLHGRKWTMFELFFLCRCCLLFYFFLLLNVAHWSMTCSNCILRQPCNKHIVKSKYLYCIEAASVTDVPVAANWAGNFLKNQNFKKYFKIKIIFSAEFSALFIVLN